MHFEIFPTCGKHAQCGRLICPSSPLCQPCACMPKGRGCRARYSQYWKEVCQARDSQNWLLRVKTSALVNFQLIYRYISERCSGDEIAHWSIMTWRIWCATPPDCILQYSNLNTVRLMINNTQFAIVANHSCTCCTKWRTVCTNAAECCEAAEHNNHVCSGETPLEYLSPSFSHDAGLKL